MRSLLNVLKNRNLIGYVQKAYLKSDMVKARKKYPLQKALYGGRYMVTALTGMKLDVEMLQFVRKIFSNCGCPIDFEFLSLEDGEQYWNELENAIASVKRNQVCLMGNLQTSKTIDSIWKKNIIREELDLRVAVMHCKSYPGVPAKINNVDVIVIRQNTESEYTMKEHEPRKGIVEHIKIMTKESSESVARFAFEYAKRHKRKKITTVHQQKILEVVDGLFLQCCKDVAKEYPDIEHVDMAVDRCCLRLVRNPQQFDIILSPHLYGSIVAITLCGLTSGVSLYPFCNVGQEIAVFEPGFSYGINEDEADYVNPVAYVNASVQMLFYLDLPNYAKMIQRAVRKTINESKVHTRDLQGQARTADVIEEILKHLPKGNDKVYTK